MCVLSLSSSTRWLLSRYGSLTDDYTSHLHLPVILLHFDLYRPFATWQYHVLLSSLVLLENIKVHLKLRGACLNVLCCVTAIHLNFASNSKLTVYYSMPAN